MTERPAATYAQQVERAKLTVRAREEVDYLLRTMNVTRAELARRLGRTRAHITQLLGAQNMTLKSLADLAFALDHRVEVTLVPIRVEREVPSNVRYLIDFRETRRRPRDGDRSSELVIDQQLPLPVRAEVVDGKLNPVVA